MNLIIRLLRLYSLLVFARCVLSFTSIRQNSWTVLLDRLTDPVIRLGRKVISKLFPGRSFPFDPSPMAGMAVLLLAVYILRIIF